jgi:type II secretory pathway pseudopilin PulG
MRHGGRLWHAEDGYAMAALLVALAVLSIMASAVLPMYSTQAKRERELELIFRGEQYARAIDLFQRTYPNVYPPSVDILLEQRLLRKRYRDPMTPDGEFVLIRGGLSRLDRTTDLGRRVSGAPADALFGTDGISGVFSASRERGLIEYNGYRQYNEWAFVHVPRTPGAAARGTRAAESVRQSPRPLRLGPGPSR